METDYSKIQAPHSLTMYMYILFVLAFIGKPFHKLFNEAATADLYITQQIYKTW